MPFCLWGSIPGTSGSYFLALRFTRLGLIQTEGGFRKGKKVYDCLLVVAGWWYLELKLKALQFQSH